MRDFMALIIVYLLLSFIAGGVVAMITRRFLGDAGAIIAAVGTFNVVFTISIIGTAILAMRVQD